MAGGTVGGAGGRNSDVADVVVGFGVLVGLVGLGLLVWGVIEAASGRRSPGPNQALRPPGLQPPLPAPQQAPLPAPQQGEVAES